MSDDEEIVTCKTCGCTCNSIPKSNETIQQHYQLEINNLQQKLIEAENYITELENNAKDLDILRSDLLIWKDKYKRLYDAHKRVQKVNQGLEDKLLRLVELNEVDKNLLTKDVAVVSHKLAEANYTIKKLNVENERYKNDVSLAVQFLQCKNGNFVSHKFDTLPRELRGKITEFLNNKKKSVDEHRKSYEAKSIKVPIPVNPNSSMIYKFTSSASEDNSSETLDQDSCEKPAIDVVSAAIMAKIFEERSREKTLKHCETCLCAKSNNNLTETSNRDSINISSTNLLRDSIRNKLKETTDCQSNQIAKVAPNNYLTPTSGEVLPKALPTSNNLSEDLPSVNAKSGKVGKHTNSRASFPNVVYFNINEKKARNRNKITKYGAYESLHSSEDDSSVIYTDQSCDENSANENSFTTGNCNDSGISINNSYSKITNKTSSLVEKPLSVVNKELINFNDSTLKITEETVKNCTDNLEISNGNQITTPVGNNTFCSPKRSLEQIRTSKYFINKNLNIATIPELPDNVNIATIVDGNTETTENLDYLSQNVLKSPKTPFSPQKSQTDDSNLVKLDNIPFSPRAFDKSPSQNKTKGPRFCSLLVQNGTNDVLLDNSEETDRPVLYRRNIPTTCTDDCQSPRHGDTSLSSSGGGDGIVDSYDELNVTTTTTQSQSDVTSGSDEPVSPATSPMPPVMELPADVNVTSSWLTDDLDLTTSQSESLDESEKVVEMDREQYEEMERNVKRFLFGDANLLSMLGGALDQ